MTAAARADLEPCSVEAVEAAGAAWNELAASPFLTVEWLGAWWRAFGHGQALAAFVRAPDGALRGAAWCRVARGGELTAPTDSDHSHEWDVLAADEAARREVWDAIARRGARRVLLTPLRPESADAACEGLERGGYRVVRNRAQTSPYLALPATFDELLGSISGNLRHQFRHNRRALEREGALVVRTAEDDVERDLETFLALEASGWKGRAGTAILSDPRAQALYQGFALAAARAGWLRLSILEAGGTPVAASYDCAFAGRCLHLKAAFDERYADRSPGLVMMGEALRRSIEEGLREYDFLGAADRHKLRWGAQTRDRFTVRGYRGAALPAYAYRGKLRPLLGRARRRFHRAPR